MFENLGRKLKVGVKVKVLAKPYASFKGMDTRLPCGPSKLIAGSEGVISSNVHYWLLPFCPTVDVTVGTRTETIDVTHLRVVKVD